MLLQQARPSASTTEPPAALFHWTCAQAQLQRSLSLVAHAVSRSSLDLGRMPLLGFLRLEVRDGLLSIAATNLEISITARMPLAESPDGVQAGVVLVPAQLLLNLVSNMPEGEVRVSVTSTFLLTLEHARGTAQLKGMSAEQYFPLPDAEEGDAPLLLPLGPLKAVIRQVAIAAAREDSLLALTCLFAHLEQDTLVLAATDRFRTASATLHLPGTHAPACDLLIPQRSLLELAAVLPSEGMVLLRVTPGGGQVLLHTPSLTCSSRLLEGRFPNYGAILPRKEDRQTRAVIKTAAFEEIVRLTAIYARTQEGMDALSLSLSSPAGMGPGLLRIASEAIELGGGQNAIPAVIEGDDIGPIRFHYHLLLDALTVTTTAEVALEIGPMRVKTSNGEMISAPVGVLKPIGSPACIHAFLSLSSGA